MDIRIGKVTHYYSHLGVAVLELDDPLQLGDMVLFLGHTTELIQEVTSLEVNHHKIQAAVPGPGDCRQGQRSGARRRPGV